MERWVFARVEYLLSNRSNFSRWPSARYPKHGAASRARATSSASRGQWVQSTCVDTSGDNELSCPAALYAVTAK